MGTSLRVLIIEDSTDDAELLIRELRTGGYDPAYERVETSAALVTALNKQTWDLVLSDYSLPHLTGADALARVMERELDVPFIFISGTSGEEAAVEAMKAGAQDYVMKGNTTRLLPIVERQLHDISY
jgi:DNA-binding NtrC family response regulator